MVISKGSKNLASENFKIFELQHLVSLTSQHLWEQIGFKAKVYYSKSELKMPQNELWWFYYIFYFYVASSIIYCYCINYFYKDPLRLYTSPTTEPHENEKANKDDKKTEEQFPQTKITHNGNFQVTNTPTTKLVNTTSVSKNAVTKETKTTIDKKI